MTRDEIIAKQIEMGLPEAWKPVCSNCGEHADFTEQSGQFTETHGLDCGPYETWTENWLTCSKCGAKTDERELAANQGAA